MMDQKSSADMVDNTPRDDEMSRAMQGTLNEAAERVTFHRVELERWERIGRAAAVGLHELQMAQPVEQQAAEHFFGGDAPLPSQASNYVTR